MKTRNWIFVALALALAATGCGQAVVSSDQANAGATAIAGMTATAKAPGVPPPATQAATVGIPPPAPPVSPTPGVPPPATQAAPPPTLVPVPPTQAPPVAPPARPTIGQPPTGNFQQTKCAYLRQWLKDQGLDDLDGLKLQAWFAQQVGIPKERVAIHRYACGDGTDTPDGAIVLGSNEGWTGDVDVWPWDFEAADSYDTSNGAKYEGCVSRVGGNTLRVWGEKKVAHVRANRVTWWIVNDANPQWDPLPREKWPCTNSPAASVPVSGPTPGPGATPHVPATDGGGQICMLGSALAAQKGWSLVDPQSSDITMYGGARVRLPQGTILPVGWDWVGAPGSSPSQGGVFSIYPPNTRACRVDTLGVSQ